jgi:membrane-bound metal-dependent hydrolase YbcI (DUF457 family)
MAIGNTFFMPNADKHIMIGAPVSAGVNLLCQWLVQLEDPAQRIDWGEVLLSGLAGAAASLLPDMLEPATSPAHRQVCHSAMAGLLVFHLASGKHCHSLEPVVRRLLLAGAAGYISHLTLDAGTPAGIRLL